MIDIFIKTYPGDFNWLEYCIKSIERFVTGFRQIIIVTDTGTELKIDSSLPIKIIYEELPNIEHPCPVGVGYVWAQNIKLNWTDYTDASHVLQIDSDTIFTDNLDLSYYKIDNKIKWFYRQWSEAGVGEIHRIPTDFFIKRESTRDHMPSPTWFFSRKTTELFQKWVNENWESTWKYLSETAKPLWITGSWGSCEYHMYGNFIEFFYTDEYELLHITEYGVPIKQFWSWGGLTDDIKKEIDSLLQ